MTIEPLISHFESVIGNTISSYHFTSGGDINEAYCIEAGEMKYFVKLNKYHQGKLMLKTEANSLLSIQETGSIPAAQVITQNEYNGVSYLLLDWIDFSPKLKGQWQNFGIKLANLHKVTYPAFGFTENNFIGTLMQSNNWHDLWIDFYRNERIIPQLRLAFNDSLLTKSDLDNGESICCKLANFCPDEKSSLIHGDLWSGNFLFDNKNQAILIDPCVYYGHREMDIAMSKLFGGFHPDFYYAYQETYPLVPDLSSRLEIYQLYYLLVHLNLFGSSYLPKCRAILKKFA